MTQMIAGYDTTMFRPDDELKALASAAIAHGVDGCFADGRTPARGAGGARGRATGGRAWIADLEARKHPWFFMSTGDGFYHHHRAWADDLRLPFTAITGYIAQIRAGTSLDRPKDRLLAERNRIAAEYAQLLATPEERASFEEMLGLCRHVFPHAEGHKFFIEHWGTSLFFNKMREIGAVMAENGFFESAEDVFYLNIARGARGALRPRARVVGRRGRARDGLLAAARQAAQGDPRAALRVDAAAGARRRARGHHRPDGAAAVGRHRRPAARLGRARPRTRTSRGYAASPGVVEGIARVVRDVNEIGTVQQGEVLVCSVTAPSWGPVFPKIAAAVSDIGGMMSHAAIVAREYGLPAVVGTGHATKLIKTGDRVRVDGDNGTVTILS